MVLTKQSWRVIWFSQSLKSTCSAVFASNVYKIWLIFQNDCVILINHVLNKLVNGKLL